MGLPALVCAGEQIDWYIRGLALAGDYHSFALKSLEERFGDEQYLDSRYMSKLLQLQSVRSIHDLKAVRKLYGLVKSQVRSLQTMGITSKKHGLLLITVSSSFQDP